MIQNTTCTCAACSNIRNLDLKLVVHHGAYIEQAIGGRKELGGPDVILIHRLMKNSIVPTTGIRAYAAFTDAAVAAIGLAEFFADATRHVEKIDEFGDVPLRVLNMQPAWERHKSHRHVGIEPGDPQLFEEVAAHLQMTPDRCWHYLTTPELRGKFVDNVEKLTRSGTDRGRPGVGAVDHCAHGDGSVLVFNIIEWRHTSKSLSPRAWAADPDDDRTFASVHGLPHRGAHGCWSARIRRASIAALHLPDAGSQDPRGLDRFVPEARRSGEAGRG
jgi:hypothetical protein